MTRFAPRQIPRRAFLGAVTGIGAAAMMGGCTTELGAARTPTRLTAVACENFWGSIVQQIGGSRLPVTSIIADPAVDPHDYEPKTNDARLVAGARYVVINGAGYDPWAAKLIAANPVTGRKVLTVAELFGKKDGDNPHLWYNPDYVLQTVDRISTDLQTLDPPGASVYEAQCTAFKTVALQPYTDAIAAIKQRYSGTAVGASESIFVYLAEALGLKLVTPPGFLNAITASSDPTAGDKATADAQITGRKIAVYVYNAQNATPDVDRQRDKAQSLGIPVVAITETPAMPMQPFQEWQTAQLHALMRALAQATNQ